MHDHVDMHTCTSHKSFFLFKFFPKNDDDDDDEDADIDDNDNVSLYKLYTHNFKCYMFKHIYRKSVIKLGEKSNPFFFHLIHFMYNRRNVMITAFSYMVAFVFVHPYYIQTSFLLHST